LLDIIRANSREPIANEGDIYALIACCEAGAERLCAMMQDFGLSDLDALGAHIISTSQAGTEAAIAEIPDGTYHNVMRVEGYEEPLELHATLVVSGCSITVDFEGTSPCSAKGINVPLNYATAYTVFGLRCLIGPDIPNNAGSLAPFVVTGPPGCILNAQNPAPVAMRHTLGQVTPDLVLGCLAQALPEAVPAEGASCMYDLPMRHVAGASRHFAIEPVHNGGTGARPFADGLSATAFPSGVFGSQVEITEAMAPVTIWHRELIPDSGGAGQFRGGLGQRIEVTPASEDPVLIFLSVERLQFPARGRAGGQDGAVGRITVDGRAVPGKGQIQVQPGQTLVFETPGGGGFGPPSARDPAAVARDIAMGFVTQTGDDPQ